MLKKTEKGFSVGEDGDFYFKCFRVEENFKNIHVFFFSSSCLSNIEGMVFSKDSLVSLIQ